MELKQGILLQKGRKGEMEREREGEEEAEEDWGEMTQWLRPEPRSPELM